MTDQFSDKIMNEISEHKVCPRPCWFYNLKRISIWAILVGLVLIIGWSLSIDWYLLSSYDWETARQTNVPLWRHVVLAMPYLWLVIAGLGMYLVMALVRRTDSGYRWPIIRALCVVLVIGGVIGFFGHISRGDKIIHEEMMRSNLYRASVFTNDDLWSRPEWGILSGTIVGHDKDDNLMIRDSKNRVWNVAADEVEDFDGPLVELKEGINMRFKGIKQDTCQSAPVFRAKSFKNK